MDILNFISWIKGKRIVKTLNKTDLIPIGVRTETRDDKYITVAITASDFAEQITPPAPEPTYKVYTALLTQSGEDNPLSIDTGLLTIGVTYYINNPSLGMDFTNVGSPSNNTGTYFVATGTTPNSWGAGQGTSNGTLTYNIGAPIVIVLENTLGNVWFTYNDIGQYLVNSNELFINNKSFAIIGTPTESGINNNFAGIVPSGTSIFAIDVVEEGPVDDLLQNTPIEIRVYN